MALQGTALQPLESWQPCGTLPATAPVTLECMARAKAVTGALPGPGHHPACSAAWAWAWALRSGGRNAELALWLWEGAGRALEVHLDAGKSPRPRKRQVRKPRGRERAGSARKPGSTSEYSGLARCRAGRSARALQQTCQKQQEASHHRLCPGTLVTYVWQSLTCPA